MNRIRRHYAIVGENPSDIFLPLVDYRFDQYPDLVLFYPPHVESNAEAIASYVNNNFGRKVELIPLPSAVESDGIGIIFEQHAVSHEVSSAVLNLSGCAPLYAIPAFQAFAKAGHPVFVVEQDSDQLLWLSNGAGNYAPFNVADESSLRKFLVGHAVQWIAAEQTCHRVKHDWNLAALSFARAAPHCRDAVKALGVYAKGGVVDEAVFQDSDFKNLSGILSSNGICSLVDGRPQFDSAEAKNFASGGWLEYAVFYAARNLLKEGLIQDLVCGLKVEKAGALAEWDVVFLANNNLHIIECKATAFLGMDALFKLESLARAVGAYSMLISLAPPTDPERKRAAEMDIKCMTWGGGVSLEDVIRQWIKGILAE